MATTKVSSKDAVSLLKEMDVKSVSKSTPPDELAKKLKKFVKAAGDSLDTGDKHLNRVFKELSKAYEEGDTVKVFGGAASSNGQKGKPKDEDEDEDGDDTEEMEGEDEDGDEDEDENEKPKKGGKKVKTSKGKRERSGESVAAMIAKALGKATERRPVSLDDLAQINVDKTGCDEASAKRNVAWYIGKFRSGERNFPKLRIEKSDKGYWVKSKK